MTSEVQICNMALLSLHEKTITSLTDDASNRALICNTFYELTRDAVLEGFPWNFAIVRSDSLARSSTNPKYGYLYRYALPNSPKCLRVLDVNGDRDLDWKVEAGYLLTDETAVQVRYISQVTDVNKFSPAFVMLLAARLAAEICYGVTQNRAKEDEAWKIYEAKEFDAFSNQSQEGSKTDTDESTDLIDVRV